MSKITIIARTALIVAVTIITIALVTLLLQKKQQKKYPYFLFISDIHLNTSGNQTSYGCDTGMQLWDSFLKKIKPMIDSKTDPPKFIIFTGDLPGHCSTTNHCNYNNSCTTQSYQKCQGVHNANDSVALNGLRKLVDGTGISLLYLPGNNDALNDGISNTDYHSFANAKGQTPFILSPSQANPFPVLNGKVINGNISLGYYSASPISGLRIISLNSVIYSKSFVTDDGTDKKNDGNLQMTFLANELKVAAQNQEKVYIAMHIPPGKNIYGSGDSLMWSNYSVKWLNNFLGIVNNHSDIIAGILYGHTHMDELRRLYDQTGKIVTEVAISCPGVSPDHCNNPGFKAVQFDSASKEIMDFTTYYTGSINGPVWGNNSYNFSQEFQKDPDTSIYDFLSNTNMSTSAIANKMKLIYKVKNGNANPVTISNGIEVYWVK